MEQTFTYRAAVCFSMKMFKDDRGAKALKSMKII